MVRLSNQIFPGLTLYMASMEKMQPLILLKMATTQKLTVSSKENALARN